MSRSSRLSSLEETVINLIKNSLNKQLSIEVLENALALKSAKDKNRLKKTITRLVAKKILHRQGNIIQYKDLPRQKKS